MLPKYNKVLP